MNHPTHPTSSSGSPSCERIRDLMFDLLDSVQYVEVSTNGQDNTQDEVRSHIAACRDCEAYQADILTVHHLLEKPMDDIPIPTGLADRVMAKIAEEQAQASLINETTSHPAMQDRLDQPTIQRSWHQWKRHPMVPAIAAVLVVLAGWMASTTLLTPDTSRQQNLLSSTLKINPGILKESSMDETDYISSDYELDGQKIAYASEDRILDPTWIGSGEAVASDIPMTTHRSPRSSSFIVPEADQDDPLSSVVGF